MKNASNDAAQSALASERAELGLPPLPNSRTADKFVLRTTGGVMDVIAELGEQNRRSANAEVIAATVESLNGRKRANAIRRAFVNQLGESQAALVLSAVEPFVMDDSPPIERDAHRFPDGVRASVSQAAKRLSAERGTVITMNAWIVDAVIWWINNQRECCALLNAVVQLEDAQENCLKGASA